MKFLTNILAKAGLIVDGTATFNSVAAASVDTDKFLVSDAGVLKYRTGSQVLSDIGAASSSSGLPIGGSAGQILAKIDGTDYNAEWIDNYTTDIRQEVKAGEAINKGQAVYISSADGTNVVVSKASNASEATSSKTLGLLAQNLANNAKGFVITEGKLSGIDTSTAQAGDPVWLGTAGNLIFGLSNKPVAPAHLVYIGVVTRSNQNNGEIFVHIQNGFELNEIHDVLVGSYGSKDVLWRDTSTNLWKNKDIFTLMGSASGSSDGYLTSTDWNTFNNKFSLPSLTSGSVLFSNGTTIAQDNAKFFWNDSENRLGIGTNNPANTLDVVRGTAGTMGRGVYESASFSYNGDMKLGIYTSAAAGSGGASLMFANTNITAAGNYPGFELQFIPSTTLASNYMRFNSVGRDSTGTVVSSVQDILSIFQSGNISVGSNSNLGYKFDVSGTGRFQSRLNVGHTESSIATLDTRSATSDTTLYVDNTRGTGTNYAGIFQASGVANNIAGYFNATYGTSNIALKADYGDVILNNASGTTRVGSLSGTGTRMVVTDGSGVLSAQAITVGTVTSVSALTIGTTGTDITSTVANSTTTPVITLNVPTASATNRGALSSTDWSTFNSKQGAITLTTNGLSGASTFSSNILNIPNYGAISYGIISGGIVTWSTGLTFDITPCNYYINDVNYTTPATSLTLDPADPTYDRIDVFAVNTSGQVVVIKGTPALNPIEPEGDTATTLGLTNVTIAANATTPSGVTYETIYDEDLSSPTEWSKNAIISGGTYNSGDTAFANTGTKSYLVTLSSGGTRAFSSSFVRPTEGDITNYKSLSFAIRLSSAVPSNTSIQISFWNGTTIVTNKYSLSVNNTVGFNRTLLNTWQKITVPLDGSLLKFKNNKFTRFILEVVGAGFTFRFDTLQLNSGISNPTGGGTTSVNSFGFVNGTTGTATAAQATDTLTVVGTGLATTSATGKTLTIAVPDPIPTQTGNNGKYLTTNGSAVSWASVDALPSQSGNTGKYLTTDGSTASWATINALPSQTGNNGKFLTTDGSSASWVTISTTNIYSADGTLTGNRTLSSGGYNLYLNAPVSVGVASINSSAQLQVDSTTKGALFPRMNLTQRLAISSPAIGLIVYQTDTTEGLYQYTSSGWQQVGFAPTFGTSSLLFNYYNFI